MPIGIRNLEWLNHNSQRSYPLAADTSKTDISGIFKLPDDFIVNLILPVHWGLSINTGKFFIKQVAVFSTGFSVTVGYAADSGDIVVASAIVARNLHTLNQVYNLSGVGDFADSIGHITIGSLDNIDKQPSGLFNFNFIDTRLEPDCIRPQLRGVTALQIQNGSDVSQDLTGKIRIIAGNNTKIDVIAVPGEDTKLVFNAISGEGLTNACVCSDEAPPIKTILGVAPNAEGNLVFLGNDCLNIIEGEHSLEFRDECSQPCCGCKELEAITKALEAFGDMATTIRQSLAGVESRVTQMDMVVLGSRLNDRACDTDC